MSTCSTGSTSTVPPSAVARRARLALFAREGFTDAARDRAAREGVLLVTAADLFADD